MAAGAVAAEEFPAAVAAETMTEGVEAATTATAATAVVAVVDTAAVAAAAMAAEETLRPHLPPVVPRSLETITIIN